MPATESTSQEVRDNCVDHLDALYASALRLTNSPVEASDLVQDTYIKVLRFSEKFRPGTNLRAWMMKILVNTFINKYRRKTKERRAAEEFVDEPVYENFYARDEQRRVTDPEGAIFGRLVRADILRALESMQPEFRATVVLADVEELSYREIAEAMSCPVGTVMSRLFRARRLLRGLLHDQASEAGIGEEAAAPAAMAGAQGRDGAADGAAPDGPTIDLAHYRRRRAAGASGGTGGAAGDGGATR
ncbi:MAG TPA: sigma-70 family RNA polymerase sigma factor [Myxococcota bacterium]|jgi:RNA polymerase sigma-70 factor (ECF subfamily)|nr:sigma-70 family RNA polymerase sigma factor [Myxococcota bacterium]